MPRSPPSFRSSPFFCASFEPYLLSSFLLSTARLLDNDMRFFERFFPFLNSLRAGSKRRRLFRLRVFFSPASAPATLFHLDLPLEVTSRWGRLPNSSQEPFFITVELLPNVDVSAPLIFCAARFPCTSDLFGVNRLIYFFCGLIKFHAPRRI